MKLASLAQQILKEEEEKATIDKLDQAMGSAFQMMGSELKSKEKVAKQDVEQADVQEAIQMAGFDSFYTKEHGRKNIAVYEPTQVKSATGNVGTYDISNPDVRYSLRTHFPDAKATREAVKDVTAPDTPEFKQFFRSSEFVNKDDEPRIMYHGTRSEEHTSELQSH